MNHRHLVRIEIRNHLFFFPKYRATCAHCGYQGNWRGSEASAVSDGWYHDDTTLYKLFTEKPTVES